MQTPGGAGGGALSGPPPSLRGSAPIRKGKGVRRERYGDPGSGLVRARCPDTCTDTGSKGVRRLRHRGVHAWGRLPAIMRVR